jgi:putative ABC transport system permease protein
MIKNHFLIAWRGLRKGRMNSVIKIAGLAAGMAVTTLIGLWIWDELSFDHYHDHHDHIASVMIREQVNGDVRVGGVIPLPMEAAMEKGYAADFRHIVMSSWNDGHILSIGDKHVAYPGVFIGSGAPDMLSLRMVRGSRNGLRGPSSLLLSESVARALFGDGDPMGKTIMLDNKVGFLVAGVYADLPLNSSFHDVAFMAPWDFFVHAQDWIDRDPADWDNTSLFMYVQTADHVDLATASRKVRDIVLNNAGSKHAAFKPEVFLQPMNRWHLWSQFKNGVETGGAIEYVWLFGVIGCFVLLLACINFMNLSTAASAKRAKEVGIRKAIGSLRGQLIGQFFVESLLYSGLAFACSLVVVWLVLPAFNALSGKEMAMLWDKPMFWVLGVGFTGLVGLIAGSYPAFYLSSFRPVKVLKGVFRAGRFAAMPRRVLVVLQFTVSVVLIIGTVVVFRQIQYAKDRPVGYNRDGLVLIETATTDLHDHFDAVKTDLLQSGKVVGIAESTSPTTGLNNDRGDVSWVGKDPKMVPDFGIVGVTKDYGWTVGWQFVVGRDFLDRKTDSDAIVLNEAAVRYMGLRDPVGQMVHMGKWDLRVVGVIKDMVVGSPYLDVKQTIFRLGKGTFDYVNIRIDPRASAHEGIATIGAVCKTYSPAVPFSYKFVDDEYAKKFVSEERVGQLARCFAVLAVFISCLGLFGMASFMAEQRVKEIGVRKVLGASVLRLWSLLSREFVVLVGLSLLIAMPLGYYFMHSWLQHYSYRVGMPWWIFAGAGVAAVVVTLVTVSYQGIKAAMMNPVRSLRSE